LGETSLKTDFNSNAMKIKNNYFDGLKVTRKHLLLFILVASSYFFEVFDNAIFGYTAPALMATMNIDTSALARIASLYYLGNTIGGIFGGILSDIIGRRKTILISTILFSSGTLIDAVTSNITVFTIGRTLTGFGVMSMLVVTITYMAELSPKESRGKWEGIISGIGYIAVPLVGIICQLILPLHPEAWRYIYYLGSLGLVAFFISIFVLKESPRWLMSRGRVTEAEAVVSGLTGVPIDLSEVNIVIQEKEKASNVISEMFSPMYIKRTIVLLICLSCGVVSLQIVAPWITTLLKMSGFGMKESLLLSTIFSCGIPLGMFVAGYFSDKGGRKLPIVAFGFLYAIVVILMAYLIGNFWLIAVFGVLMNVFAVARNFIIHPYVAESYPTKIRNSVTGLLNGVSRFASAGAQLVVPMLFAGYGLGGVFGFVAALSVFGSLVVLIFGWRSAHVSLEDINENFAKEGTGSGSGSAGMKA